jgi:hypothetical protein
MMSWKLDPLPSSGVTGSYSVGHIKAANLNQWTLFLILTYLHHQMSSVGGRNTNANQTDMSVDVKYRHWELGAQTTAN